MADIEFRGGRYPVEPGETVLDCLTRHGALIPSKCKGGACKKCMVRATSGRIPEAAQKGLRDTMTAQDYFLSCLCEPTSDLSIAPIDVADHRVTLTVTERAEPTPRLVRFRFSPSERFDYRPGQCVNLIRPSDERVRSYCLATMPEEDLLEIHIRRTPEGNMGPWLCKSLKAGDKITAYGPVGDCFYLPTDLTRPLLLVALESGLGAIYGVLKDALFHDHSGPIHLIHAGERAEDIYLSDEMSGLAARHDNFTYTPSCTHGEPPPGGRTGKVENVVTEVVGNLDGYRAYLAGDPAGIKTLRRTIFLNGADMTAIYAVSFNP
ncbi:MAG: 2Fe-2S iron-sulfur cluster-binding protein [Leptospirillia bacterium]